MQQFAERGFRDATLEDIAEQAGVTRGALLKHFGSKEELFFEAHKEAALMLAAYTDAPEEVLEQGFFATFRYWLENDHLMHEEYVPYRVAVLGFYSSELEMQRRINRFWLTEDPEKTLDFLEFGQGRREVRTDLDPYAVAALLDWIEEGVQRSIAVEELDRGLFHRAGGEERRRLVIDTVMEVLRHGLERREEPRERTEAPESTSEN
jgi:AcrR family transcriptional regulator